MQLAVFLCDRTWTVTRVLANSLRLPLDEGSQLSGVVRNPQSLPETEALAEEGHAFASLRFPGLPDAVPTLLFSYPERFLVAAAHVQGPRDFTAFQEQLARHLAWADDNVKAPFRDEYYRIELLNNRLLNSERAMAKKNARLERALEEIRRANDSISVLERDRVTNLYSARGFERRIERALQEDGSTAFEVSVLEVDGMRLVSELRGEQAREALLKAIAMFLVGLADDGDVALACVNRSYFYALSPMQARFGQTIAERFDDFAKSYPLSVHLRARVGVYAIDERTVSGEEACNRARLALDAAPRRGGSVARFDRAVRDKLLEENRLLDRLPEALANDEFKLYLQPKVDMTTGFAVGAEALVRWEHPELGFISPASFVPLFEREGCIYEVDHVIWEKACSFINERRRRGLPRLPISVNVARSDLYERDFAAALRELVARHGLAQGDLHLEVLERAWAKDSDALCEVFGGLKALGFTIEMDDFGTGESSLALLANLPVDVLKLDRGFIVKGLGDCRRIEVIRCIVELARSLNMAVIAEGVETVEQERALLSLGCRFAQGFLYAKPQPAESFLDRTVP